MIVSVPQMVHADRTFMVPIANLQKFQKQGITLSNYFAVTHPSEPNYITAVGGDYFGMDNDAFWQVPANVSTLIDLLEDKSISWAEYQEDLPYSGYEGFQYLNAAGKNDYVRKHKYVVCLILIGSCLLYLSPAIIYNSVAENENRLAQIKNFTMFDEDLKNDKLPQWMFITPNMSRFHRPQAIPAFFQHTDLHSR